MDIQEVAARFKHVQWRGNNTCMAECPCHKDRKQSLGISEKDGKILINCLAGCSKEAILKAAGLTMSDLFREPKKAGLSRDPAARIKEGLERWKDLPVEKIYTYCDERGNALHSKVRFRGKVITFVTIDPETGRFRPGLNGTRRTLYRLPELARAVKAGETVYYVEGEKDADTMKAMGLTATTAGGVNDWRSEYAKHFAGADVVILPDNDEPGQKLAERVQRELLAVAASVKVVMTSQAAHGDVTDWINEGHSKEELLALCAAEAAARPEAAQSGVRSIDAMALLNKRFDPLLQPVEGLICEGLTLLVGASKIGKSWLVMDMCLSVASGEDFLGRRTHPGKVLYLALEDSQRRLKSRIKKIGKTVTRDLSLATESAILGEGLEDQIDQWVRSSPGASMLVIDTLQKVRSITSRGINAYQADYADLGRFKAIADKHHIAIVMVHHTNKLRAPEDSFDKISGSSAIMGAADTVILVNRERGSNEATVRLEGRDVWGEDFIIRFNDCRWDVAFNDADEHFLAARHAATPLVMLFRKLIAEKPNGGRWSYEQLKAEGLRLLGFQPFIDGKDCAKKLAGGLADDLRRRDNILVECGVRTTGGRGVSLENVKPVTELQSRIEGA